MNESRRARARSRNQRRGPQSTIDRTEAAAAILPILDELELAGWVVERDVAWPYPDASVIDHVLIGNGHVFALAGYAWDGDITADGGVLRVNGRAQVGELAAVAEAAESLVAGVPGISERAVTPVLVAVHDGWVSHRIGKVQVSSTAILAETLRSEPTGHRPLSDDQTADLVTRLWQPRPTPSLARDAQDGRRRGWARIRSLRAGSTAVA